MKTVCLVYILFYIMLMFYDDKPCKPKHCIQDILSSSRALGLAFSPSARQGILIQLRGRLQRTSGKWGGGVVLKFRTFPDWGRGWFVKVRTSENF